MAEARDHGRGVLVVDLHVEVEADVQALGLQLGDDRNQFLGVWRSPECGSSHGVSGRNPSRSIVGLVHAGRVEVADALDHAALGSADAAELLEDLLEDGEVAFVDFLVHAIGGVFAGDRHFLEGAVGVGIEILAGRDGQIHVRPVHAGDRLGGRLSIGSLAADLEINFHRAGTAKKITAALSHAHLDINTPHVRIHNSRRPEQAQRGSGNPIANERKPEPRCALFRPTFCNPPRSPSPPAPLPKGRGETIERHPLSVQPSRYLRRSRSLASGQSVTWPVAPS